MKHFLLLLFIISMVSVNAQSEKTDSLWAVWYNKHLVDSARFNALYWLIWDVYLPRQPDSALYYSQELKKAAHAEKNIRWEARVLTLQGIYYAKKSNYAKAIRAFKRGLQLWKKPCNGSAYINIGNCYVHLADYATALEYFQKAQADFKVCGKERGYFKVYYHIAEVLNASGAYEQAETNYLKAASLYKEEDIELAQAFVGLGEVRMNLGAYQAAFDYFTKALKLATQNKDKYAQAYIYNILGKLFYKKKKWKQARQYFEVGLDIYGELDNRKGLAFSNIELGRIALQNLQIESALKYCAKGLKLAEEATLLNEKKDACNCLYKAHENQGNAPKALQYFELLSQTKDSLFSSERTKKLTTLQLNYAHQQEKTKLENEKKLKDITIANQRRTIALILLLLLVLVIGGGVIYAQKNKLGAAYGTLVQKSKEIIRQEKELKKVKTSLISTTYNDKQLTDLQSKVIIALEEEKAFLNSDITLSKLATNLDTNTSYLSKTINSVFNKNFNTLINEYRIKQVISDIEENAHDIYTIETLANNAGFKSRSAFNKAF